MIEAALAGVAEAAASAIEALPETSVTEVESSLEPSLENNFVETRLDNPSEAWSGDNLDVSKHHIKDVPNPLLEETKTQVHEHLKEYNWDPEVVDSIRSVEEADIYIDANLQEGIINDRPCLQNPEINWEQSNTVTLQNSETSIVRGDIPEGFGKLDDMYSVSNKERALHGMAPLDSNGQPFELHHIGQRMNSPLAELTFEQHRGVGNDVVLHEKTVPSQIDRNAFHAERIDYWKARAEMLN